jgi:hypothetical protein
VRLAAETLLVVLALVQQVAGLSSWQSSLLTVGYLVAIVSTKPTLWCAGGTAIDLALGR